MSSVQAMLPSEGGAGGALIVVPGRSATFLFAVAVLAFPSGLAARQGSLAMGPSGSAFGSRSPLDPNARSRRVKPASASGVGPDRS